eukprot:gene6510-7803_t
MYPAEVATLLRALGRSAETLSGKGFKRLMEECSFLGADQPITRRAPPLTAAVIFARCRPRGEMHLRYEDFVAALGYVARLRSTSDIGAGAHGSVDLQAEMSGMVDLLTHHGIPYTVAYDLSRKSHPRARRSPPPSVRTVRAASTGEEPPPPLNTGRDHPPKPQLISPPETPQPLWGEGIERIPGHAAGVTPPRSPSGGASKGAAVSEALQAISHITLLDPITLIEPAASMKNHFLHSLRRLHDDDDDSDA